MGIKIAPQLIVAVLCAQVLCAAAELELSVMSFNVRWDGLDKGRNAWESRRPLAIETIRASAPDVVGLQEPSIAQTRDLDEGLEDYVSFRAPHERDQHLTFLYRQERFLLQEGGSFWLVAESELSGGTRRCVWVHLRDQETGRGFYVFNNHFDHRSRESRMRSAYALLAGIHQRHHSEDPFVVVGDLNEVETGPAIRYLKGELNPVEEVIEDERPPVFLVDTFRHLHPDQLDAASGHGFIGRITGVRIDYVFVRPRDQILDARIIHYHEGDLYPSDHYPVMARVRLHAETQG